MLFAHHMAVELFGREFSPHGPLQHACAFGAIGLVMALTIYGGWSLAQKARDAVRSRDGV